MTTIHTRARGKRKVPAAGRTTQHVLPLHHRIYIVLRRRLVEGEYPPDRPIPGEHQLAADFNSSRVTIRRVLDQLQKEQLIDRRHGAGTYPVAPAASGQAAAQSMSYYDYIAASGQAYDDKLLEFSDIATPSFLMQLDARFGPKVVKIVRVACRGAVPYHILTAYLPGDLAAAVSRRTIGNKTVLEFLKKEGIVPATSELRLGAIAADTFEARHLKVHVGVPLVRAIRISRLKDGRTIEYNQILSVADLFGYRFHFDGRSGALILPPPTVS
jgi:GntR family transcriptional regulator